MRVISGANGKAPWTFTYKCKGCRREVEATEDDIRVGWVEDMVGWRDEGYSAAIVTCFCGKDQVIKSPPKSWKKRNNIA